MKLKTALLRIAAAAVIALAAPLIANLIAAAPARAEVNVGVSINFGNFYDRLAPYGDWTDYNGRTVWVPTRRPAQWQPYQQGHWAYTRRYGWMWVSAEPFGWATYHYGRWGFSPDIGWYWVPGYRWAPAWVSWRRSDNYVGWSPLPVGYPDNGGVNVTIAPVPDFYWQVVPSRAFLSVNLAGVIIRDRHRADPFFRHARPVGHVRIVNNIVVNNVIGVTFVERWTHKKVRTYRVREGRKPGMRARRTGGFIEVYAPRVHKGGKHKPNRLRSVNEVKAWHKKHHADESRKWQQFRNKDKKQQLPAVQNGKKKQQLDQKAKQKQQQDQKAKQKQLRDQKAKQKQQQDQKAKQKQLRDQKAKQKQRQDQKAKQKQRQDQKAKQKQRQDQKAKQKQLRDQKTKQKQLRDQKAKQKQLRDQKAKQKQRQDQKAKQKQLRDQKAKQKQQQDHKAKQKQRQDQKAKQKKKKKQQDQQQVQ